MSDDRKDLPPVNAANFLERVREVLSTYLGNRGSLLDRGVTLRDLSDAGVVDLSGTYVASRRGTPVAGVGSAVEPVYEIDLTPPPTPTGFSVTATLGNLIVECDSQLYRSGHGHLTSVLYGATWVSGALPTFASAVEVTQFPGTVYSYPTALGTTWHLWLKWQTADGVLSATPAGGTNGVVATTGKIGNTDLGPLIIEAGNLANGSVTATKIAAASLDATKFASSIEPVTVVSSVPGTKSTSSIFNTTDNKLYTWNGTAYAAPTSVPAAGSLVASMFASSIEPVTVVSGTNPTVKSTNSIFNTTDQKMYVWTGSAYATQTAVIGAGSVTLTSFASGIEPITVVSSVPGTKSTNAIVNTTDGKLYRWNGSAYVATVPTTDLSGTVSDAQIAALAASKVTGTLTNAQIADLAATKITGTLVSTQIANAAITAAKFASGIAPVEIVATLPTTGNYQGRTAFLTTDNKLYRHTGSAWVSAVPSTDITGTLTDAQIAAVAATKVTGTLSDSQLAAIAATKITGTLVSTQIADNAITTAKFASTIEPVTLVTSVPGTKSTSSIFNTTDGKMYRWSGTAYVATVAGSDITGTVPAVNIGAGLTAAQITSVNAAAVGNGLTGTQIAAATITGSNMVANTVTAGQIAANTITASQIAANTITAGQIAANTITASQIAADTITAGQIAAGAITSSELATGSVIAGKISAGVITATEIAASTITGANIAATTITGANMVAGTVTAGQIAAGTITATEIAGATITGAKIAAGTIAAGNIVSATITSTQIAAGTITASNIATDTITAGQIAAGAISASEVAAGAITTAKLLVTGRGAALNADPSMSDASGWSGGAYTLQTVTDPYSGRNTLRGTSGVTIFSDSFHVDIGKKYRVRAVARRDATATGAFYLRMLFADSTGTTIATYNVANVENQTLTTAWAVFESSAFSPLSNAVTARVAVVLNWNIATGYHEVQDVRAEQVIDASLIVDGAITTNKLLANAVTAAKIAANTITATQIAASTITATEIAGATITGAKIAAGTIAAGNIVSGTITTTQIAANTITASNIAADTITAGQIAAGAISASEVAAGAITTAKLLVTGGGAALNDDPNCMDQSAWVQWGGTTVATVTAITDGKTGNSVLRSTAGVNSRSIGVRPTPCDSGKTYRLSAWVRQSATGNGVLYLRTVDYSGAEVFSGGLERTYAGLELVSPPAGVWTRYQTQFTVPSGRVSVTPHILLGWTGTVGYMEAQDIRIEEVIEANLIIDGAITTNKLQANAVTAAKIAANTITAGQIAAGTISATQIAANTIGAGQIAAGSITGNEIAANSVNADRLVANSITAGKIQAGAITAAEIATNAITTSKLVLADFNNLIPNPDFNTGNTAGWNRITLTGGGTITAIPASTGGVPASASTINVLRFAHTGGGETSITAGDGNFNLGGLPGGVPVTVGETYTLLVEAGGTAGTGLVLELITKTAAGTIAAPGSIGPAITSSWATYSVTFTSAVSGKLYARIGFYAGGAHTSYVTNVRLFKRASADLIVDGAITANKIATNALAVGTAAIQNGAIVNAMIGSLAVDDAKIGSMSVAKLTAGSLAVGQYIQSTSFVAGTSGWRINADGTAEIATAVVRGAVFASSGTIGGNTIDATGIQSAGYTAGSTGWRFDTSGLIKAFSASGANVLDMSATGTSPVLKIGTKLSILANGTATFGGDISAATGTFAGGLNVTPGGTGARIEIKTNVIKVYDSSNVLRVRIGDLTA